MQRLPLADQFFPVVLSGEKTNTMRWREMRIIPGPLQFFSETDRYPDCTVMVVRCTDVPLRDAADLVNMRAVWPDQKMLAAMQRHYPDITLDDLVQVIEHLPPEDGTR